MATHYVDSNASGTNAGTSWVNAWDSIETAFDSASVAAGDIVKIEYRHNKQYTSDPTPAAIANSLFNPAILVSCDKDNSDAYRAGAIEDSDTSASHTTYGAGGFCFYGVTFIAYDFNWSNGSYIFMYECSVSTYRNYNPSEYSTTIWEGVTYKPRHTGANLNGGRGSNWRWLGGSIDVTVATPDALFNDATYTCKLFLQGVDLSTFTGSNILKTASWRADYLVLEGCKLHATKPTLVGSITYHLPLGIISIIGCNSSNAPYFHFTSSQGNVYFDTAEYLDAKYDGVNGYSAKMVSSANARYNNPMRYKLCDIWCAANPTLTVHFTHNINGDNSDAQNDELWLEIEYPDSAVAAYRKWDRTSKMTILGTAADLTTEADPGWNVGQGAYNKIEEVIAGGAAGIHTIWVCLARASETVYVDPKVDVS